MANDTDKRFVSYAFEQGFDYEDGLGFVATGRTAEEARAALVQQLEEATRERWEDADAEEREYLLLPIAERFSVHTTIVPV